MEHFVCARARGLVARMYRCALENGKPCDCPSLSTAPESTPPVDPIDHPPHYNSHPSGVECITVVEHMNFCRGNAVKYLWRAGEKGDELEDLKKARWYVDREIARVQAARKRGG